MSRVDFFEKLLDGVELKFVPMGRVISRVREKGKSNPSIKTVYSVSNIHGLVKAQDFRDNIIHSEDTSNYTIIKYGMFAYNPARLNIGSIAFLRNDLAGLVSPMYVVFSVDEKIITKEYLNYFIESRYCMNKISSLTEEGARFRFDFERWNLIDVPIPPLEIQAKIVRILDAFAELTNELTNELTTRKKQYNYYRDQLLSFEEGGVEWKTLGELFPFIRNGFVGTVTPYYTNSENGVRYLQGTNIQKGSINDKNKYYVTKEFHDKCARTKLKTDDILVVQSGHVGESAVVGEKYEDCNCHALIVMSNGGECNSKFVNYFLQTAEGKSRLAQITTGGTVKHILASKIKGMKIPLPALTEQARIVAILDKFDALTNSLTEGLPREIELRQKQYEHYRDLLLSFPKPQEVAA